MIKLEFRDGTDAVINPTHKYQCVCQTTIKKAKQGRNINLGEFVMLNNETKEIKEVICIKLVDNGNGKTEDSSTE